MRIIRRRARLAPPAPGRPGPFSLGQPGAVEQVFFDSGFREVESEVIDAPVHMASARECVRFERESFGALHQMMGGMSAAEQEETWQEIEEELRQFETADGFVGPCELVVGVGTK